MMLHQVMTLERPFILFDTETTGVDPQRDRIIEVGFELWTAEGRQKEWRSLVNPAPDVIPQGAIDTHHITNELIASCRACRQPKDAHGQLASDACDEFKPVPAFRDLAENLAKGFSNCDFGGQNVRFDLRMLAAEFARADVAWSCVGARIVDSSRLEQLGEPRHLSDLYEKHTGRKLEGAHSALADAKASGEIIAAQLARYRALPRSLDLLHAAQFPGMIDLDGKFRFVDGVAVCCFGKWRDKPLPAIERSYWDWILGADFPADVKAVAANAKLGKFPEERR